MEKNHPILEPGTRVDHFSVLRLIGRGGMGEVYLARDMMLGRKVALKVLNAKHIGSASMVESLMEEARITARFSHPHIVMIHAVGEHEESPYLALEYLEGQPLRERLRQERPGMRESLRIILAVAEALATAHGGGVLHLDLKPGNVFLPKDGRIRVLDFGIARRSAEVPTWDMEEAPASDDSKAAPISASAHLEPASGDDPTPKKDLVLGTPAYLSPETWLGAPAQAARDLWALGIIAYELLTGKHPYPGLKRSLLRRRVCSPDPMPPMGSSNISSEVTELIAGLLSKDPKGRPPAQEVVSVLHKQLHPSRSGLTAEEGPFQGLLPFGERHADLFFGREAEVGAFVERLRQESVLPVVGPSGVGKSSFVQAGVIPRLREQGAWRVLSMRPGQQPFAALAGRLTAGQTSGGTVPSPDDVPTVSSEDLYSDDPAPVPVEDAETLAQELHASPMLLRLRLLEYARRLGSRVLLFVDQLEELYTLVEDELERQAFMQAVCEAADDPQGPVRVIFTVRDDFLVRLAEGAAARDAFSRVTVLRSPGPEALAEILVRPVELAGYSYEDPDMVPQMIESILEEPSSLPLLQFAAHTLWERRDRKERKLKLASYEAMGGVAGALAEHADGVLTRMVPDQQATAREALLRLVTPQRTRRVIARSRLVDGLAGEAESVVRMLVQARLLSVRRGAGAEPVLELAHESLIQGWTQLARWIEEGREDLVFLAEVDQAAEMWERRGRRPEEVWHDDALHDALRSLDRCSAQVPAVVRKFLESGRARETQIRRRKRLLSYSGIAVLVLVAAVSTLATFVIARGRREARQQRHRAEEQKRRAEAQRQRARTRWAEAQREGARAALQRGDRVGASAKLRGSLEMGDSSLARALWWALKRSPLKWRKDLGAGIYAVSCAADGKTVAVASMSHAVYLVDTRTLQVRVLRGHTDQTLNVIFAAGGGRVISSSISGEVFVWSVRTGRIVQRLTGHTRSVRGLALSPDGRRLASGSYDQTVRIWDLETGQAVRVFGGKIGRVFSVAYSPDGGRLYVSSTRGRIFVIDTRTGAHLQVLRAKKASVLTVAVSPDGKRLASASTDLMVRLWRLPDGTLERELRGHAGPVSKVAFSPDGRLLASGGGDQTVRVWRADTGGVIRTFREHKRGVRGLAFTPDGAGVLSGSMDHTLRLWRLRPSVTRSTQNGPAKAVRMIAFSPDSKRLASGGGERDVQLWDLVGGTVKEVLTGHTHAVFSLAFSPDGKRLASGSEDRTVRLWSLSDRQRPLVLAGHRGVVESLVFGPGGRQLWSASWDGTIRLWDATSARQLRVLKGHAGTVQEIALNRAGTHLASASNDKTVRLWHTASGRLLRELTGHSHMVYGVTFSPDGRRLATGGADRALWLWQVATGKGRPFGKHPGRIYYLHFHPGGQKLGVPYSNGTARIWDLRTGRYVELRGHRDEVNAFRFSPDGRYAATCSDDGTVRLWDGASGHPLWRAPALLASPPRLVSHRGWTRLDGQTGSPPRIRPQWQRTVRRSASHAALASGGTLACLQTFGDKLEMWDTVADKRLRVSSLPGLTQVLALPDGCVTLARGKVHFHRRAGPPRVLVGGTSTVAWDGGHVLAASAGQVRVLSLAGRTQANYPASRGVTALTRAGDWLVLGYKDGSIELVSTKGRERVPSFRFESIPACPVVRLLAGPKNTVIAGFANGLVGIWLLKNGARVDHAWLHGPVVHLLVEGGKLYAASELGSHVTLDLGAFVLGYCELLREVWRAVPVVWESGQPVLRKQPSLHSCARP